MLTEQPVVASADGRTGTLQHHLAEIASVPKREAGHVLSQGNIWIAAALTLLPIGTGLVLGLGGIAWGISLGGASPAAALACVAAAIACGAASLTVLLCYQQWLPSRFLRGVARRAMARRGDALVRVDDPEAVFVDVVPRSNWGKTMLEPAVDTGFLRVDHERREILLEGDSKRYRIPFEAVVTCDVEEIRMDSDDWASDLHFATVLTVDTASGPREIPLSLRHVRFQVRRMPQRRAEAEAFCANIVMAIAS